MSGDPEVGRREAAWQRAIVRERIDTAAAQAGAVTLALRAGKQIEAQHRITLVLRELHSATDALGEPEGD